MLALFYQYLIRHQQIVLPGLGTVLLQRQPAVSDFADHNFLPPSYSFEWIQASANPPRNFFIWMAQKLNIAEEDAAMRINNFISDVKRELNAGKEIQWTGVGIIRRGLDSGIELETESRTFPFETTVHAEKVIREHSSHSVLVGDEEKNSLEMADLLHAAPARKIPWLTIAIVAAILLVIFIVTYFWKYGMNTGTAANQNKLTPKEAPATYQKVQ